MKHKKLILFCGICSCIYGNVFAVSPYANTIQQNIQKKSFLALASFPQTAADATFVERMENKVEGYRPYFNRSAFADLTIKEQDELESMAYRAEQMRQNTFRTLTRTEYCENYPADSINCPQITSATPNEQTPTESIYVTTPNVGGTTTNTPYMRAALTDNNVAKYNLKTHNGGCTPPERSNWARNTIQTSGQYQYSHPAFEKFMITAFRKEGDCGSHPDDHGGYTCYGCASNGLCAGVDFKTLTRAKVENLAYDKIYKPYNVEKLPDAFRGYALWGMWGSGSVTGIKLFQSALGATRTGKIDDATIRAAENYTGDFGDAYTRAHEQFYRNIVARDSSQSVFLKGWLNSLELLRPSGCHVVPTTPIYR